MKSILLQDIRRIPRQSKKDRDGRQATIEPILRETIAPGMIVYTDEYDVYSRVTQRCISQEKLPLYLAFFQFVHNMQNEGKHSSTRSLSDFWQDLPGTPDEPLRFPICCTILSQKQAALS